MSMFRPQGSQPVNPVELLPFPPPRRYMSVEESERALEAFFGGIQKRQIMENN